MKTVRKLAIGVGALSAMTSVAHAQTNATATAAGSATIIQPITASSGAPLAFGTIVKPNDTNASTVTVTPAGARTVTGTAVALASTTPTSASFSVVGESGSAYSVGVPSTFNMTSGANTLVVTTSNNNSQFNGLIGGTGAQIGSTATNTFHVGGAFNISQGTPSGAYQGNIVVTAAYQ